jgi:hypothetical protein
MYRDPDQYACCFVDRADGTPFIEFVNKQMIVYNAADSACAYMSDARFQFLLFVKEDKFSFKWGFLRSEKPYNILVDVRSLYNQKGIRDDVALIGDGTFRLTRTMEKGLSLVALIDPSLSCPFKQIQVSEVESSEPVLLIRELAVNDQVREFWPVFPAKARLADKVKLVDGSKVGSVESNDSLQFVEKSFAARLAIRDKTWRDTYEKRYRVQVDWDKVEAQDRKISRAIRELLPDTLKCN